MNNTSYNKSRRLVIEMKTVCPYLRRNLSNIVQSVHHIVQQLELVVTQAAEVQGPRSTACLDDTGNVLHTPRLLKMLDSVRLVSALGGSVVPCLCGQWMMMQLT